MESSIARLGGIQQPPRDSVAAPRAIARLAGLLYIVIAIAAGVAHAYVPGQLIVPGDSAATVGNIMASTSLFRLGIASQYLILLSEVALSILLFMLLRPVSRTLALIATAFRLTMTAVHAASLISLLVILRLLGSAGQPVVADAEQLHGLVQLLLDAHRTGFAVGIVFLIPHVFLLGYLIYGSDYLPRFLGVLFLLAGCGYLIDSIALLFVPGYHETPGVLALMIAAAEIALPLWLLLKGVNSEQWHSRAAA